MEIIKTILSIDIKQIYASLERLSYHVAFVESLQYSLCYSEKCTAPVASVALLCHKCLP